MHFLTYTEEQPNSSTTVTCFYWSDDTLHDKPSFCMNFPVQIKHITIVTKEVICEGFSWPFSGSLDVYHWFNVLFTTRKFQQQCKWHEFCIYLHYKTNTECTSPNAVKNCMTLQSLLSPASCITPVTAMTLPLWFHLQHTAVMPVSINTGTGQKTKFPYVKHKSKNEHVYKYSEQTFYRNLFTIDQKLYKCTCRNMNTFE